jgi:DedD protein
MDRRVKERLVGASILVAIIVLIVPELLSGPTPTPVTAKPPVSTPEPVRNVTVDLAPSKAPTPAAEPAARPPEAPGGMPVGGAASSGAASSGDAPSVRLETATPRPTSAAAAAKPTTASGAWAVQLGSFASRDNADKLLRQLRAQGFSVFMSSGGSGPSLRYRVRIGPMADRGAAAQEVAKLKSLGHAATIVPPAP